MLFPAKHENLERSLLVLGSDMLAILKKKDCNIERLFSELNVTKEITLEQFYNTITFLWLSGLIGKNDFNLYLKR